MSYTASGPLEAQEGAAGRWVRRNITRLWNYGLTYAMGRDIILK